VTGETACTTAFEARLWPYCVSLDDQYCRSYYKKHELIILIITVLRSIKYYYYSYNKYSEFNARDRRDGLYRRVGGQALAVLRELDSQYCRSYHYQ